jgi:hypothetical protein
MWFWTLLHWTHHPLLPKGRRWCCLDPGLLACPPGIVLMDNAGQPLRFSATPSSSLLSLHCALTPPRNLLLPTPLPLLLRLLLRG